MKCNSITLFILSFIVIQCAVFAQQRGAVLLPDSSKRKQMTLYHQSHALVIGVSTYSNGLPSLDFVQRDVDSVKVALEKRGFEVETVNNPTKSSFDKAMNDFISTYGQDFDNRLLIYFAGHGYTHRMSGGRQMGYILPSDAINPVSNSSTFQSKAIPMDQIKIYMEQINAKHVLFVFDACFAGIIFHKHKSVPTEFILSNLST